MVKYFKDLLDNLPAIETPDNLRAKILLAIESRVQRRRRIKAGCFFVLDLSSFFALVWSAIYLGNLLGQSGFYNYLTLLWSDSSLISVIWYDFATSLSESLPVVGLSVFLLFGLVFLWSASRTFKNLLIVK